MSKSAFDVAREALTTIEFFRVPYSSGHEMQEIYAQVLFTVRLAARNEPNHSQQKFLQLFADALEQANK